MLKKNNLAKIAAILLMLVMMSPVIAQEAGEPTPSAEAIVAPLIDGEATPEVSPVADNQEEGATAFDWLQFIIENDLQWYLFALIGIFVAGNLVPQNVLAERREAARKTDTPIDDVLVAILEGVQSLKKQSEPVTTGGNVQNPTLNDELDKLKENPTLNPSPNSGRDLTTPKLPAGVPLAYFGYQKHESGRPFYEERHNGRQVAIPAGYSYVGMPALINGELSAHCDVFYKNGAYEFAVAQKAGRFMYQVDLKNWVLAERSRYAIVVKYSHAFTPYQKNGDPLVYIGGVLKSGGLVNPIVDQPITADSTEAQWVIETTHDYRDLKIAVGIYMPWASIEERGATVTIHDIKFVPVADDYGGENVIRI